MYFYVFFLVINIVSVQLAELDCSMYYWWTTAKVENWKNSLQVNTFVVY